MPVKKTPKKEDPFKTRKTKVVEAKENDTITPPAEIAEAIDAFRESQDQAKHYEGEATVHKDAILNYSTGEFTKRIFNGMNKSFKILGHQAMVTYVVMDSSAGLSEEDVQAIKARWGQKAAEDLVVRDLGSIRFNSEVFEANYDAIVKALQVLPEEVLNNLFKPMLMKAKPGAVEAAKQYAKKPADLQELLQALKIKNYIR